MRRAELERAYYFFCDCERCNAPETIEISAACPNKKCTYPRMPADVNNNCIKCGTIFPDSFQEKFNQVTELSIYHLDKMAHTACILFFFFYFF